VTPQQATPDPPGGLRPGERVHAAFGKYDGSPHWEYLAWHLGADEHGAWLGGASGTVLSRPGRRLVWDAPFVVLAPPGRWCVVTLNAPTRVARSEVYVDITTPPTWRPGAGPAGVAQVRAVDLDLDVVRRFGEREPFVDDEDEFDAHRALMRYPPEVVAAARAECDRVLGQLRRGDEPFGSVAAQWLARAPGIIADGDR
jgi:hypothetical protein